MSFDVAELIKTLEIISQAGTEIWPFEMLMCRRKKNISQIWQP